MNEQYPERRICPERACAAESWQVRPHASVPGVWCVADDDGGAWTVAAEDPICPCCGTTLVTLLELDGGLGDSGMAEVGPLFDFARSL